MGSLIYLFWSLMGYKSDSLSPPHSLSLSMLTAHQHNLIKGHLVDMDNWFNEVFPFIDPLNPEFRPGNRIIDHFSNCFSFYLYNKKSDNPFKDRIQQLDNLAIESSNSLLSVLVIIDASVKNNITTSIVHIHIHNKPMVKTLHHAINTTSTEVEFFALRCSIN